MDVGARVPNAADAVPVFGARDRPHHAGEPFHRVQGVSNGERINGPRAIFVLNGGQSSRLH